MSTTVLHKKRGTQRVGGKKRTNISRGGCLWCGEATDSIFSQGHSECNCGNYRPKGKSGGICRCGHGEIWHDRENKLEKIVSRKTLTSGNSGLIKYIDSLEKNIQQLHGDIGCQEQIQAGLVSDVQDLQDEVDGLTEKLDQRCDDDVTVCIICLKDNRSVLYLPCKHAQYCKECSDRWLEQSNKCPVCRGVVEAQLDIIL